MLPCSTPHELYIFSDRTMPIPLVLYLLLRYDLNDCNTGPLSLPFSSVEINCIDAQNCKKKLICFLEI